MTDRLLTRHFVRRFILENEIVSPQADRHEVLSIAGAAMIVSGLFVTILLALKYHFQPFQSPGRTALLALDDRGLYVALSMLVMALVALAVWDGLSLDTRDAAILGPLPVSRRRIARAKASAIVLFAGGGCLALNAVPAVLHPLLMAGRLPIGLGAGLWLVVIHAVTTTAAGTCAFLFVLAARELLRACLGDRSFARVSSAVQGSLVAGAATALLLVPALSAGAVRTWLADSAWPAVAAPVVWYVGLFEWLAGNTVVGLPRIELDPGIARWERIATIRYRDHQPLFQELALTAMIALATVLLIAAAAYAYNARRLPASTPTGTNRVRTTLARLHALVARRIIVRDLVSRAGYQFAVRCFARSAPHRLAIVTALGFGFAGTVIALHGGGDDDFSWPAGHVPAGVLASQSLLVAAIAAGFWHALRVPAELKANWTVRLAWTGDRRRFVAGVRRAALSTLVAPLLAVLYPFHAVILGMSPAAAHALVGLVLAMALLELAFWSFRDLPFTSAYAPIPGLKAIAPLGVSAIAAGSYVLALLERETITHPRSAALLVGSLAAIVVVLRLRERTRERQRIAPVAFDDAPLSDTPRLNLTG